MFWYISNGTLHSDMFSNHFVMKEHKHHVNTGNKCNLHINKSKTSFSHQSIKVPVAHIFNEFPLEIKKTPIFKIFL